MGSHIRVQEVANYVVEGSGRSDRTVPCMVAAVCALVDLQVRNLEAFIHHIYVAKNSP